jgi:hypothetical protein
VTELPADLAALVPLLELALQRQQAPPPLPAAEPRLGLAAVKREPEAAPQ